MNNIVACNIGCIFSFGQDFFFLPRVFLLVRMVASVHNAAQFSLVF